jgi:hypothetical protein
MARAKAVCFAPPATFVLQYGEQGVVSFGAGVRFTAKSIGPKQIKMNDFFIHEKGRPPDGAAYAGDLV